ncbi:hypothetical protein JHW43_007858, partial [Diplocarpon mali]
RPPIEIAPFQGSSFAAAQLPLPIAHTARVSLASRLGTCVELELVPLALVWPNSESGRGSASREGAGAARAVLTRLSPPPPRGWADGMGIESRSDADTSSRHGRRTTPRPIESHPADPAASLGTCKPARRS